MFMRLVQLNVEKQEIDRFRETYQDEVINKLQKTAGCRFVGLIESGAEECEFISLTLWDDQKQAESYEESGTYKELLGKVRPFLQNSSEWKIQLSENLELEYKQVQDEPVIKKFSVQAQGDRNGKVGINSHLYVRIVSLSIQDGKEDEFKKIFTNEIIPELIATRGCRYAYLTRSTQDSNAFISVTIWDSRDDADFYESSGKFKVLVGKVSHTFSQFYRWKMALERDYDASIKTSEDMKVERYNVVTGKNFY